MDENALARKTLELSQYRSQYYAVMAEAAASAADVAPGQSDGWLRQETQRQLDLIAEAMATDPSKPYSNADHSAARESMLAFPASRITYVRCEGGKQTGQALPAGCQ